MLNLNFVVNMSIFNFKICSYKYLDNIIKTVKNIINLSKILFKTHTYKNREQNLNKKFENRVKFSSERMFWNITLV